MNQSAGPPAQYNLELPPTLYGDDLVNGNSSLMMTQSMDPAAMAAAAAAGGGLTDNGQINSQVRIFGFFAATFFLFKSD